MEKPDVGGSWFDKLFGGGKKSSPSQPPPVAPPVVVNPNNNRQYKSIDTTYDINNSTMLAQHQEALKYRSFIEEAARIYSFQPVVLCGIGSRESHWGLALKPPGPGGRGDFSRRRPRGQRRTPTPPDGEGYGRGLMQIDYDWHEFARTGKWYSPKENIMYACSVLDDSRKFFIENIKLDEDRLLRAILASYNAGATATLRAIQEGQDIDANTTGRDYSRDVLNRSGWFQLHDWQ